jgi:hypothetical protein
MNVSCHAAVLLAAALLPGCVGTTGSDLFEFEAHAAGPEDAEGGPLSFDNSRGYAVTLSRARLHVGAVYLNRSVPASVSSDTTCTLPGIYVAEVTAGLDVDLLSPAPVAFPIAGDATEERARAGEVWLTGGNVNAPSDPTKILEVAGAARKDGVEIRFEGVVTIGENWAVSPANPALPGANPICKERIVTPVPADLPLRSGGGLLLRSDPRGFFANVDFSTLPEGDSPGGVRSFADGPENQASINLYLGLHAARGTYTFEWLQ